MYIFCKIRIAVFYAIICLYYVCVFLLSVVGQPTCRRYMAEKLPIRRKTLPNQSINQSINQGIAHLVLVGSNPSNLAFLAGPCSNRSPGSPSTDNSSRRSPRPSASGTRTERVRASGRGPPPSHDFCQACSLGKYRQRIAVVRRVHNNTDYRRHPDFK